MRVLLDAHVLLWVVAEPGRLPDWARTLIESPETEVLFSAVSNTCAMGSLLGKLPYNRPRNSGAALDATLTALRDGSK